MRVQLEEQAQRVNDNENEGDIEAEVQPAGCRPVGEKMAVHRRHDEADGCQQKHRPAGTRAGSVEPLRLELEPACQDAGSQDQQDIADDAARERRLDDAVLPLRQRGQADDQLGGITESGVEQPTQPRAYAMGQMLRRQSHQPGQRDDGQSGEDEHPCL